MSEGKFIVDDSVVLVSKTWPVAEGTAEKGKILFLHDLTEYSGCYDEFFPEFAAAGYEIVTYDQRGSGKSIRDGRSAGITNEHFVFDDLNRIIAQLFSSWGTEDEPYKGKFFLWGNGMGASIALNYAVKGAYRERVDGYIAGSTWVTLGSDVFSAWTLKVQLPLLAKVKPKSQFTKKFRWEKMANDDERIAKLRNDPVIRYTFSAGQIEGCIDRAQRLHNSLFVSKFIDRPVLLLHGTDDSVFPIAGAQSFFDILKVEDKQFLTLDKFLHQPYNHVKEERDEYRDDIVNWLNTKSEGGESSYVQFTPAAPAPEEETPAATAAEDTPAAAEESTAAAPTEDTTKDAAETSTEGAAVATASEETATEQIAAAVEEPNSEVATAADETAVSEAPIAEEAVAETEVPTQSEETAVPESDSTVPETEKSEAQPEAAVAAEKLETVTSESGEAESAAQPPTVDPESTPAEESAEDSVDPASTEGETGESSATEDTPEPESAAGEDAAKTSSAPKKKNNKKKGKKGGKRK